MTTKRKLDILWELYFIAVGLDMDTLMIKKEIFGFCTTLGYLDLGLDEYDEILDYLERFATFKDKPYHHPPGDWKIRSKVLLKAIEELSKNN